MIQTSPNLGSAVLSRVTSRLSDDWLERYGRALQARPCRRGSRLMANSLCCERLSRHPKPGHFTTTDFRGAMAADHDRATISLVTSKNPHLPQPNPTRKLRA